LAVAAAGGMKEGQQTARARKQDAERMIRFEIFLT
jgi:hypothetical protein